MQFELVPVELIDPPTIAHRRDFDPESLEELRASIAALGLINPITVEKEGNRYRIRAGHRRFLALMMNGAHTAPCIIRPPENTLHAEAVTWAENLARADLSPIEEAEAIGRMLRTGKLDVPAIARALNRSVPWVESRTSLLEMPPHMQAFVHSHELAIATALTLQRVTDPQHRDYLLRYAIDAGASHAVIREWVSAWETATASGGDATAVLPPPPGLLGPIIVHAPCLTCRRAFDHSQMHIARICKECMAQLVHIQDDPPAAG